jgi:hypothetical protein
MGRAFCRTISGIRSDFFWRRATQAHLSLGGHIAITNGHGGRRQPASATVGQGLASRISAHTGEGVLNGLLTARVGLSALAVCRPMPFSVDKPTGVSEVAPFLFSKGEQPLLPVGTRVGDEGGGGDLAHASKISPNSSQLSPLNVASCIWRIGL